MNKKFIPVIVIGTLIIFGSIAWLIDYYSPLKTAAIVYMTENKCVAATTERCKSFIDNANTGEIQGEFISILCK